MALPWTMVWKLMELLAGVAGCDLKMRLTFLKTQHNTTKQNKTPFNSGEMTKREFYMCSESCDVRIIIMIMKIIYCVLTTCQTLL